MFILGLGVILYYYFNSIPKSTVSTFQMSPTPQQQVDLAPSDWVTYQSLELGTKLNHPSHAEVTENDGLLRIIIIGPSQAEGTEVYDGLLMFFEKGQYEENNLRDYVSGVAEGRKSDPVYESVGVIEETSINGINGYTFVDSALGTFTNIYLQLDGNTFLNITYLLEDPENQGFEETKDTILKSITLL